MIELSPTYHCIYPTGHCTRAETRARHKVLKETVPRNRFKTETAADAARQLLPDPSQFFVCEGADISF